MANRYKDRPYAVGKGKPPVHTRFGQGQDPRRGGRPKGARNHDMIIEEALNARVTIQEDGKTRRASRFDVVITQLLHSAMKRDLRAIGMVIDLKCKLDARGEQPEQHFLSDADRAILEEIVQRQNGKGAGDE